jgi:hypothetical protein
LEHFKKLQGNVEFYQNKCHPGNAPTGPTLQPSVSFLGGDALQDAVEWNPSPEIDGGRAAWPAGHVAGPAG